MNAALSIISIYGRASRRSGRGGTLLGYITIGYVTLRRGESLVEVLAPFYPDRGVSDSCALKDALAPPCARLPMPTTDR
jgi:hypothetical protein